MNEREYQKMELTRFLNQKSRYFDTVKEFDANLSDMDILEQIEWIENGSYGAGACFALQITLNRITPRMNARAAIGKTVLHAFYGAPFTGWNKLSPLVQEKINSAIDAWMNQEHSFASKLEI